MWSELSTRHLLALRAVAEEGTFGRAATRLGFTQSAVSQQVAALEAMVGHTLFDRPAGPNPPQLTAAGELLLDQSRTVLDAIQHAETELDRFARGVSGRLSVGTFQSVSTRVLPATLSQLYSEAPGVEISLLEEDPHLELRSNMVTDGDLDLAFAIGEVSNTLETLYLGDDPFVAVVGADHVAGPVDLHTIGCAPMIGHPQSDSCAALLDRQLEQHGISPNYTFRSHDNAAVQGMVGAGVGIALMPMLAVDINDPATSLRPTLPILAARELYLVWAKARELSPLAERFIAIVRTVCAEYLSCVPTCPTPTNTTP